MRKAFNNLSIQTKILMIASVQAVLLTCVFMSFFVWQVKDNAEEDTVAQARRVVTMAESIRSEMSDKWKQGIFEQETLREWAHAGETEKVVSSVPIVTAWEAVMARADEGGYTFKTPKINARNSANEPDDFEKEALAAFSADDQLSEYSIFDKNENAIRYFRPIRLEQECMICHGDPEDSYALWGNKDGLDPTGFEMEGYSVGDLHGAFEVIQSMDAADQRAQSTIVAGIVLTVVVLLPCLFLLAFFVRRTIVSPIDETVATLKDIATGDGDLTKRLDADGKDEVKQLAHWFNTFVERIEGVVRQIAKGASTLNQASDSVVANASGVTEGAEQSKEQSATVKTAANEMSNSMEDVSRNTTQMSDKLASVSSSVQEMQRMIARIAANAEENASVADDAETAVQKSHGHIGDMGTAADQIGDIVNMIQDIAEQTNLLALNATIEAARAGSAGKGFAVVASEVKELAKQTALATEDIRKQVQNVQDQSQVAVSSMDSINQVIAKVNELNRQIALAVDEQKETASGITEDVTTLAQIAQSVAGQVHETSETSRHITSNLAQVDEILNENAKGAVDSLSAGRELSDLASQMNSLVSTFSVGEEPATQTSSKA